MKAARDTVQSIKNLSAWIKELPPEVFQLPQSQKMIDNIRRNRERIPNDDPLWRSSPVSSRIFPCGSPRRVRRDRVGRGDRN